MEKQNFPRTKEEMQSEVFLCVDSENFCLSSFIYATPIMSALFNNNIFSYTFCMMTWAIWNYDDIWLTHFQKSVEFIIDHVIRYGSFSYTGEFITFLTYFLILTISK